MPARDVTATTAVVMPETAPFVTTTVPIMLFFVVWTVMPSFAAAIVTITLMFVLRHTLLPPLLKMCFVYRQKSVQPVSRTTNIDRPSMQVFHPLRCDLVQTPRGTFAFCIPGRFHQSILFYLSQRAVKHAGVSVRRFFIMCESLHQLIAVAGLLQKQQQQPGLDKTAHPATRSATASTSFMPAVMSATHNDLRLY